MIIDVKSYGIASIALILLGIVVLIVLVAGAAVVFRGTKTAPSPSPLPQEETTTTPPMLSCRLVKLYDPSWHELTLQDLESSKAGNVLFIAVASEPASATKARVRLKQGTGNYTEWTETAEKRPGGGEFFVEYQLPEGENNFRLEAEVFDSAQGVWR
ncbi:hypothetical protein HYS11_00695 [Candidatus Gottesmanbacteria bacterium]|nr:hypothetical protein [Candidatus Gottesmanbacteria bacterium]